MEFDATFLISVISFIVFVFIMNSIFYKPVLQILQKRQSYVEENYNAAKVASKESEEKTQYITSELNTARTNAQNVIAEKSQEIKNESTKIIIEHKEKTFDTISKERDSLIQSAIDAKETLKDNIVDIAKNISLRLLGDDIKSEAIDKSQIIEPEKND